MSGPPRSARPFDLAEQLYDECRPKDEDDLQQPLCREYSIEGKHRRGSLVVPHSLTALMTIKDVHGATSCWIHDAADRSDISQAVMVGRLVIDVEGMLVGGSVHRSLSE